MTALIQTHAHTDTLLLTPGHPTIAYLYVFSGPVDTLSGLS